MNIKRLLAEFVIAFAVALVVCAIVTGLWNLIAHRTYAADWATSFRLAVIFGIILPWMQRGRIGR